MYNTHLYNGARYADGLNTAAVTPADVGSASEIYRFRMHVVSGTANTVLGFLKYWHDATWHLGINEPDTLEFSLPFNDASATYLARPNLIWLTNEYGTTLQKFRILSVLNEASADGLLVKRVRCESLLGQLAEELLPSYTANMTIREIVKDWFDNYQVNARKLSFGHIVPAIGNQTASISIYGEKVLGAISKLQETYGGYFWVAPNGTFYWEDKTVAWYGLYLRYRKNIQNVTCEVDYRDQITRLYAYGRGNDARSRLNLIDAGSSVEYINSDNQATYGIVPGYVEFGDITDGPTLMTASSQYLEANKTPKYTYDIPSLVDLSQADTTLTQERLYIGAEVQVEHEPLGISVDTIISEIERKLDTPLAVHVVLTNKREDITTYLADMAGEVEEIKRQELYSDAEPVDIGTFADPGDSDYAAREDHQHEMSSSAAAAIVATMLSDEVPLGTAITASAGTGDKASRDDHQHAIGNWSTGNPQPGGSSASPGSSDGGVPRPDHVHKIVWLAYSSS